MADKGLWNELEPGLPDSRLVVDRAKGAVKRQTPFGRMWMDRVFCANCGVDGGLATPELDFIHYLCQECVSKLGPPPNMVEVPEHLVRGGGSQ